MSRRRSFLSLSSNHPILECTIHLPRETQSHHSGGKNTIAIRLPSAILLSWMGLTSLYSFKHSPKNTIPHNSSSLSPSATLSLMNRKLATTTHSCGFQATSNSPESNHKCWWMESCRCSKASNEKWEYSQFQCYEECSLDKCHSHSTLSFPFLLHMGCLRRKSDECRVNTWCWFVSAEEWKQLHLSTGLLQWREQYWWVLSISSTEWEESVFCHN